ncbi:fucolectin-like [Hyperolius riggenbachi]|uniref:fucolectin-like n=1 Tax=Hyperolius riggenbachi TaxID=752182 RepID=UPI0035A30BC7
MKVLLTLVLLGLLGLGHCCSPQSGAANLARNGAASQSSDYQLGTIIAYANKGIDGNKESNWFKGFCTHTQYDSEPWWKVDLKQKYNVDVVVITARSDCCPERMKGAEVRVGNSPDNKNPVCGKITSTPDVTTTFSCNGMEGQYVSVVIPGRSEFLHLCEVEVYGAPSTPGNKDNQGNQENHVCW